MFITDTIDAIYRPNEWHPDALLDQLSDVIANLPQVSVLESVTHLHGTDSSIRRTILPRLLLEFILLR